MPVVYILYSPTRDRYYVGSTKYFERRFREHQSGVNPSTAQGRPWTAMFTHETRTYAEARQLENKIKSWKNRRLIEKIVRDQVLHVSESVPTLRVRR